MQADLKVPSVAVVKLVLVSSRNEPESRAGDFFDYLLDMYSPPDQVELRGVRNDRHGPVRDAQHIRSYFRNALSEISCE